ncbi:MAG: hypothetical protein ACYS8Z_04440 [Planctomycetota bacterium]|jgi:hypothetical protein
MKAAGKITFLSLAVLCCLVVFGCGKEDGGTSTTSGKGDAAKMDVEQLRAAALKCKAELEAKMAESEKKAQELIKSLSVDDPEGRKKLNEEMAELSRASEALGKQLEEYVEQIKAKGGDVSDLIPTE